eukprot:108613-Chlamydomonas_euryale.AAC.8
MATNPRPNAVPRVRRLQPGVVAQVGGAGADLNRKRPVRAGLVVGSLRQAVVELVSNALDACLESGTSISVTLDIQGRSIVVADDGHGMTVSDMELLGQRHCSARVAASRTLGYRGEALSALAVSCQELSITSRASGTIESFTKTLKAGRASQLRPSLPNERLKKCGSSVKVTGFMMNQPVRLRSSSSGSSDR